MEDFKLLMKDHFKKYASYVILDRAIPNVIDGLKPVQRRILYVLWLMSDGKLHKVANVAGQTMAYHPHGDAAIIDALVNLSNKGYLLDQQGNFGNTLTGDPAAAARYIETRLSALAASTIFNPDLTPMTPSYDGRNKEPIYLPSKLPLLLLQGAEGIAVGMATKILPHNFVELLEAEIAILEGRDFTLLPDFPTGGIMDASDYNKGKGKIKLRVQVEIKDPKTLRIKEICYGTTTESLIRSIDEAAKKGKIKIEAIHDYTAGHVDIEIKLPRGQYAEEVLQALYAYTECEVSLSSQVVVIKDHLPWDTDVHEILHDHATRLEGYLRAELEIEHQRLEEKIFEKSLERIFIENRLYKQIENIKTYEKIHDAIADSLKPFHPELLREPTYDDRERLLNIPIRRISRFDLDQNVKEVENYSTALAKTHKELKNVKKYTIQYLSGLIKKYGPEFKRKTEITQIEELNRRAIETKKITIFFDPKTGFVGTKVVGTFEFEGTNFDKLLVIYKDGTYTVIPIPEKQYIQKAGEGIAFVGIADKKTVFNIIYTDPKTKLCYGKRFAIEKFILEKVYRYLDEGMQLQQLAIDARVPIELHFVPKIKQKISKQAFSFENLLIKNVTAKGIKLASRPVRKVVVG